MITQLPEELDKGQEQKGLSAKPPILQDEMPQENAELKTPSEDKLTDTASAEAGKQEVKSQPVPLDTIASAKKPDTPLQKQEQSAQTVPVNVNKSWVGEEAPQQVPSSPYQVLNEAPPIDNSNELSGQTMVGSIDEPVSGVSLAAKVGVLVLIIVVVAGGMAIVYGMTKGWDVLGLINYLPGFNDMK